VVVVLVPIVLVFGHSHGHMQDNTGIPTEDEHLQ
jgi:hypothetical protein